MRISVNTPLSMQKASANAITQVAVMNRTDIYTNSFRFVALTGVTLFNWRHY